MARSNDNDQRDGDDPVPLGKGPLKPRRASGVWGAFGFDELDGELVLTMPDGGIQRLGVKLRDKDDGA